MSKQVKVTGSSRKALMCTGKSEGKVTSLPRSFLWPYQQAPDKEESTLIPWGSTQALGKEHDPHGMRILMLRAPKGLFQHLHFPHVHIEDKEIKKKNEKER